MRHGLNFQFNEGEWHLWQDTLIVLGSGPTKEDALTNAIEEQRKVAIELDRTLNSLIRISRKLNEKENNN